MHDESFAATPGGSAGATATPSPAPRGYYVRRGDGSLVFPKNGQRGNMPPLQRSPHDAATPAALTHTPVQVRPRHLPPVPATPATTVAPPEATGGQYSPERYLGSTRAVVSALQEQASGAGTSSAPSLAHASPALRRMGAMSLESAARLPTAPTVTRSSDAELLSRSSAVALRGSLQAQLSALSDEAKEQQLSRLDVAVRCQAAFDAAALELTRQVSAHCVDRGDLLALLWIRYSTLLSTVMAAVEEDRRRRTVEEDKASEQLQRARTDYARMVEHCEALIQSHHDEFAKAQMQKADEAAALTARIEALSSTVRIQQGALLKFERREAALGGADIHATVARLHAAERRVLDLEGTVREKDLCILDGQNEIQRLLSLGRDGLQSGGVDTNASMVFTRSGSNLAAVKRSTGVDASTQTSTSARSVGHAASKGSHRPPAILVEKGSDDSGGGSVADAAAGGTSSAVPHPDRLSLSVTLATTHTGSSDDPQPISGVSSHASSFAHRATPVIGDGTTTMRSSSPTSEDDAYDDDDGAVDRRELPGEEAASAANLRAAPLQLTRSISPLSANATSRTTDDRGHTSPTSKAQNRGVGSKRQSPSV